MKPAMTAREIECAVARCFGYRANLIVPNVSWGAGLYYEADLLVVRPSGWIEEVEIKTSRSDLHRDRAKGKWRLYCLKRGPELALDRFPPTTVHLIRRYWFALPAELADDASIPPFAGILGAERNECGDIVLHEIRRPKPNKDARKATVDEVTGLYRLAAMRVWTLKAHLIRAEERRLR